MCNNKDFLLRLWRLFQENLHLLVTQTYMYLILNENEKKKKKKKTKYSTTIVKQEKELELSDFLFEKNWQWNAILTYVLVFLEKVIEVIR